MVRKFIKNRITFLNVALMLIAMALFAGCSGSGQGGQEANGGDPGTQLGESGGYPTVPVTIATPPGGTYEADEITVTLDCGDHCTETYYTFSTDGAQNTPDILYTGPITLTTTTNCVTLRFYSITPDVATEDVKTEIYYLYPSSVSYSVSGAVSGLAAGEALVLQNNGGDDLAITAEGAFTFATELADGATYDVTVLTQPPGQFCSVGNNGWIGGADATDVSVTCYDLFYAAAIVGGTWNTTAVKTDGTVWAWGLNSSAGLLGDGTTTDSSTPVQVCAEGEVAPCANFLTDVTATAAGFHHSIAVKTDGTVWTWGTNDYGQLGDGTTTGRITPVRVCAEGETAPCASFLTDVTGSTGGGDYTVAFKNGGTVWAWGTNWRGQLGNGTTIDSATPVQVSGLTDVIAVSSGYQHSIALKTDGTVWAWGSNVLGQLGDGTTTNSSTPVQVSGLTDVIAIAAGAAYTSFAVKTDGTVRAWGANWDGRLGVETTETCNSSTPCSTTPLQVSGITDVIAVVAGWGHTLALKKTDGTIWGWGDNRDGQLGDGTTTDSTTPVQVCAEGETAPCASFLTGVTAITAGYDHSIALKTDGTVWGWGANRSGQVGIAVSTNCIDGIDYYSCSTTPVPVLEAP